MVGILGLLIAGVLLTLNPFGQVQKANDAKRKSDLSQIQKALETYYQDSGRYPTHSSSPQYRIVRLDGTTADWGQQFQPYMATLPKDPRSTYSYVYYASSVGQSYWLYASLERGKGRDGNPLDPQLCNKGNPCASLVGNGIADTSCGGICNFAVSSSNVSP